jgi:hypothetical protein
MKIACICIFFLAILPPAGMKNRINARPIYSHKLNSLFYEVILRFYFTNKIVAGNDLASKVIMLASKDHMVSQNILSPFLLLTGLKTVYTS